MRRLRYGPGASQRRRSAGAGRVTSARRVQRVNTVARIRIEKELGRLVGPHLTPAEAARVAEGIDALPREIVVRLIEWTEVFARLHAELAAGFVRHAAAVATATHLAGHEPWARQAADAFDHRGLGAALAVVNNPDGFVRAFRERARGCDFDGVRRRLSTFVTGLGAPTLKIIKGVRPATDTERIWLPSAFHALESPRDNYLLYQSLAAFLWAEARYGTFTRDIVMALLRHDDLDAALTRFMALETVRLVATLERAFPGLARQMTELSERVDHDVRWRAPAAPEIVAALEAPTATASDSLAASWHVVDVPPQPCFRGAVDLGAVREVLFGRGDGRRLTVSARDNASGESDVREADATSARRAPRPGAASGTTDGAPSGGQRSGVEVTLSGDRQSRPVRTGSHGAMVRPEDEPDAPPETTAAGAGRYPAESREGAGGTPAGYDSAEIDETIEFVSEWDYERQCYRDDYCTVRLKAGDAGDEGFVTDTLERHRGTIKSIKRRFEALVGAPRIERHQEDGDEVDVDALVEAHADRTAGLGFSEYLYRRRRHAERDIAALFLVDMSGSTRGWVNQAEREALILMCEAFSLLGDRYAIFGFSGRTHKRCEVYRMKAFEERYDTAVKRRIAGISPKGYTRLGAPIRALTRRLTEVPARHRLLVTISDGKPEDYRSYRGQYGIEDTRQALVEARRLGVHAFCVTIDEAGGDYLPRMYGPANFVVLDDVMQLPHRLAEVYRRLTS